MKGVNDWRNTVHRYFYLVQYYDVEVSWSGGRYFLSGRFETDGEVNGQVR